MLTSNSLRVCIQELLQSGSPLCSVVMNVRSSTHDQSSRIKYWTLNSRNVNSVFAVNGWFIQSRSQLSVWIHLEPIGWCSHKCYCQPTVASFLGTRPAFAACSIEKPGEPGILIFSCEHDAVDKWHNNSEQKSHKFCILFDQLQVQRLVHMTAAPTS